MEEVVLMSKMPKTSWFELLEIAMHKNGDKFENAKGFQCGEVKSHVLCCGEDIFKPYLDAEIDAMSNDDIDLNFMMWTEFYVYFPRQNDYGAKWVDSVLRHPMF